LVSLTDDVHVVQMMYDFITTKLNN